MIYRKIPLISLLTGKEIESIRKLFKDHLAGTISGTHIDIACGLSPLQLSDNYEIRIALDWSKKSISTASGKHRKWSYIVGEAEHLPMKPGTADLVTIIGLTEYIQNTVQLLRELKRLTKPGGYVIFTSSPPNFLNNLRKAWNPHLTLRKESFWRVKSAKNGFEILAVANLLLQDQYILKKNE